MDCGGKHPCLPVGWGSPHLQSPRRRCRAPRQASGAHVSDSPVDERDDSRPDSEGGASPTLRSDRAGLWQYRGVPGSTSCRKRPTGPASRGQNAGSVPGSLFVRRKGAWHRSHRIPWGAERALQATMQAAGVPSARSQSYPLPPRDRADGATLGRPRHQPRRTRRPAIQDAMQRGPLPRTGAPRCLADTRSQPR